ncbi:hypothetical protein FBY10_101508 [Pseudomonas sp. SJZ103]|uniref:hypothetical protein n=1 Tax=unclassified Pseudomonas TaxID=196821 RepID=UPI0011AC6665|nr:MULTISPECIES: hypothetical protein [unclassified Pseudomonas]MCS4310151.1 hypothetical protein [Pseudomonas sp. BIGb0381]TWC74803.1 hypothetical protein FBY10_101508 [Pseudomonas sp. SJZ103]TWC93068.1 hypothetical protein FBY08_101550 [Pseudomonas sp. SJZ094]
MTRSLITMRPISTLITRFGSVGAALLFSTTAAAFTQEITAVFSPDPGNPMVNKFKNTTPISTICEFHIPARCKALDIFSLREPTFTASSNGPVLANHEDDRQGFMVQVPSDWRDLTVTHLRTGETETVQMRIAGLGGMWSVSRPPGVSAWAQPGVGWDRQWRQAPSPCQSTNHLAAGVTFASYFWLVPEGAGICNRKPSVDIPVMRFTQLEYAYELRTPNPLGMSSGEYTGSLTYTMGPRGDYDFGDVMMPSQNSITFNFTLTVQHQLQVEVPPGGNRVELIPQGGWQAWLNQGRKPARLFRDQTFNISASSRFKMQMACERVIGDTCALKNNTDGHEVPLDISVSLPHGLNRQDGAAVNRQPLLLSGAGTELFQPGFYVDRRPGTLHFEVTKDSADQMLSRGGSTYSGQVSVVWDSEV